ncbi:MAG: hypothetical protein VKI83_00260 [Synechococcaceae cyanobacterium]|nr:hypothetical protein [Synechococcaceae cyanobacterium]
MIGESLLSQVLSTLVNQGIEKWKSGKQFTTLRLLAHERLARELFWNRECLSARKKEEEASIYLALLRTDAFDELVKLSAPMQDIFPEPIHLLTGLPVEPLSPLLRRRLGDIQHRHELIDRTYHRIWMMRHRVKHGLSLGDIAYLRQLVRLSLIEVEHGIGMMTGR